MKCFVCGEFSFYAICKRCQHDFLTPTLFSRELACGLKIYSFYKYDEIEELMKSKYRVYGSKILEILAKNSFYFISKEFKFNSKISVLPIDDNPKESFSHSAILAKSLKSKTFKPRYNSLRATNRVSYAGKSLEFRLKNPRNFIYKYRNGIDAILVDDIVTTGTTLGEAYSLLMQKEVNILFALSLCDLGVKYP